MPRSCCVAPLSRGGLHLPRGHDELFGGARRRAGAPASAWHRTAPSHRSLRWTAHPAEGQARMITAWTARWHVLPRTRRHAVGRGERRPREHPVRRRWCPRARRRRRPRAESGARRARTRRSSTVGSSALWGAIRVAPCSTSSTSRRACRSARWRSRSWRRGALRGLIEETAPIIDSIESNAP